MSSVTKERLSLSLGLSLSALFFVTAYGAGSSHLRARAGGTCSRKTRIFQHVHVYKPRPRPPLQQLLPLQRLLPHQSSPRAVTRDPTAPTQTSPTSAPPPTPLAPPQTSWEAARHHGLLSRGPCLFLGLSVPSTWGSTTSQRFVEGDGPQPRRTRPRTPSPSPVPVDTPKRPLEGATEHRCGSDRRSGKVTKGLPSGGKPASSRQGGKGWRLELK